MSYRDYRYEPTINTDGDDPMGFGFGLAVLIAMFSLIYWFAA